MWPVACVQSAMAELVLCKSPCVRPKISAYITLVDYSCNLWPVSSSRAIAGLVLCKCPCLRPKIFAYIIIDYSCDLWLVSSALWPGWCFASACLRPKIFAYITLDYSCDLWPVSSSLWPGWCSASARACDPRSRRRYGCWTTVTAVSPTCLATSSTSNVPLRSFTPTPTRFVIYPG